MSWYQTGNHPGAQGRTTGQGGPGWAPPASGNAAHSAGSGTGSNTGTQTPAQSNALEWAKSVLDKWGLGDLYGHLRNWVQQGVDTTAELRLKLEGTKEYQQRFAGNAERVKNGLDALSPAQYLAMEDAYQQVLRQYDLPQGFYDSKAQSDAWIGGNVSASELQGRVQTAAQLVHSDPATRDLYKQWYGAGDITAALLDPKKTAQLVENRALAAEIGGAAASNGLSPSQNHAMQLAQYGTTLSQAQQAYAQIGQRMSTDTGIAARFNSSLSQWDEEQATLMNNGAAQAKQGLLYGMEGAQFGGHGALNPQSVSDAANY